MADIKRSSILGWVAEVKSDEDDVNSDDERQQYLASSDDIEADPDFDPDEEEPARVPEFESFPIGNTPANGKWVLTKKEQRAADLVHRQEQKPIKKREKKQDRRRGRRSSAQENGDLFTGIPPITTTVPTTAMTSLTTASLDFGLKTLNFNGTTPSISTGLGDMGLMATTHNRKRKRRQDTNKRNFKNIKEKLESEAFRIVKEGAAMSTESSLQEAHVLIMTDAVSVSRVPRADSLRSTYVDGSTGEAAAAPATNAPAFTYTEKNAPKQSPGSYNTYPSPIPHPTRGKTYVDTAIQTEPEHICIGDCRCPIWTTPKPTKTAKPRVRKVPPHVAHTQRLLALKREADARRHALLRGAGIEPPSFDPNDPEKVTFYEKRAVEGGGYKLVKNVWRNGMRIE